MADRQRIKLIYDGAELFNSMLPRRESIVLHIDGKEVFNSLVTNPVSNSDTRAPVDKSVNYELVATPVIGNNYFYKKFNDSKFTQGKLLSIAQAQSGIQEYYNQYTFDNYPGETVDHVYIESLSGKRGGESRRKKLRKSKKGRSYRKKF